MRQINSLGIDQLKRCIISMAQAVREQHGGSTSSPICNEASSNETTHPLHHIQMMSTHAVIWGSTLRASSYRAHVTLKFVSLASLGSRLDTFHSSQSNAKQRQMEPD